MKLTKNFDLTEFACHNGEQVPEHYLMNVNMLAANLQVLRDHLGEPVRINSAYRPTKYNESIGGKSKSQHLTASAADITVKSKNPKQVYAIIEKLIASKKMKQGGLGVYPGFVHYDIRGRKARW